MSRDARFWRNVALIALAHLAVVLALAVASKDPPKPNVPSVVWMNSAASETAAATPPPTAPEPERETAPPEREKEDETQVTTVARSEIHLPSPTPVPTPTPTPRPKPSATPTASPKPSASPSPKPIPKATPRKPLVAATTPKPSPKKEKRAETKDKSDSAKKELLVKKDSAPGKPESAGDGPGNGNGKGPVSEFAWYRTMLHDRFYKEWQQPKTILASGAKMSTLVKIRIENDGRVSKFTILRPSGNVVMDESVAAVTQRVTQVDPLPAGLIKGAYYEVQINFELNPEQ
jgi:TonB family protein